LSGHEYAYAAPALPASVPAGPVQVTFENVGQEEHQASIVRLNDGVDVNAFLAASASDRTQAAAFKLITAYGGPNGVGPAATGTTSQVLDKPGSYVFVCFLPTPDGLTHAAKGMVQPFTVTGSPSTAKLSTTTNVIAQEFAYQVPSGLTAGEVGLRNTGTQAHELAVYRLAAGKTVADATAFFSSPAPSGPPPFSSAGGFAAIGPGQTATTTLNLSAGKYVFICFIPDVDGGGAPHFTKGMIQEVPIT
jgi:plastocyanin